MKSAKSSGTLLCVLHIYYIMYIVLDPFTWGKKKIRSCRNKIKSDPAGIKKSRKNKSFGISVISFQNPLLKRNHWNPDGRCHTVCVVYSLQKKILTEELEMKLIFFFVGNPATRRDRIDPSFFFTVCLSPFVSTFSSRKTLWVERRRISADSAHLLNNPSEIQSCRSFYTASNTEFVWKLKNECLFVCLLCWFLSADGWKRRRKLAAGCSQLRWPVGSCWGTSQRQPKAFTNAKSQRRLLTSTRITRRLISPSLVSRLFKFQIFLFSR